MGREGGHGGAVPRDLPVSLPGLRAPAESGAILAQPPLVTLGSLLADNRSILSDTQLRIGDIPLPEIRRCAVSEAIVAARDYMGGEPAASAAGGLVAPAADAAGSPVSLFIAGHQPDLFHPGVWLKNFALNSLAKRHGALPLNLVIDNDTVKSTTVRVPILGRRDQPQSVHSIAVPFDHFAGEVPFEERAVLDEVLFADFPRAVAERTADWPFTPFLPAFWQELPPPPAHLGDRLAAGRRTWERRWGCDNPELPISRLCRTAAFAQFAMALLADLPAFHAAYNACVHEYRRSHRIRSNNHP